MSDIGRNDPCPCGSGKKYKKCCGLKEIKATKRPLTSRQIVQHTPASLQGLFGRTVQPPPQETKPLPPIQKKEG